MSRHYIHNNAKWIVIDRGDTTVHSAHHFKFFAVRKAQKIGGYILRSPTSLGGMSYPLYIGQSIEAVCGMAYPKSMPLVEPRRLRAI